MFIWTLLTALTVLVLERGVHADVVMVAAVEQLRLLVLVCQLVVAADWTLLCNILYMIRRLLPTQTIAIDIVSSGFKAMLEVLK